MPATDGSLIFNTKIDTSGMEKDAKGVSSKVVDLRNKVSSTAAAVKNLREELEKAGGTKVKTKVAEGLEREIAKAQESQFDALVSLSYNIGTGAFADSDTVKALNEGKVGHAAVDIPSWRRGMGYQILPGLEKRRQTELEFFAAGEDFTITDCMNVRTGAGTNYPVKTVSQLTANGRECAVNRSASAQAVFREGTEITALEVKAVYSPSRVDVWFRCPSGWLCARMGEEVYVK